MRIILPVLLLAVITLTLLHGNGNGAAFNLWTGEITCSTAFTCLHETGHKMDRDSGWVSKSDEWRQAVDVFIEVQWQLPVEYRCALADRVSHFPGVSAPKIPFTDPLSLSFWTGGWGSYTELYAELWAITNGNISDIPADFQRFYEVR